MQNSKRYLITEISDADFDSNYINSSELLRDFKIRKASRGLVINKDKIALLFVSKENYHKLPGGGLEGDETNKQAFIREVKEETGCNCKIIENLNQNSLIIETRQQFKLLQISYIFFSEIVGKPGKSNLDQSEIDKGFELKWVSVDEAIILLKSDKAESYEGKFITKRDLSILYFYKDTIISRNG